MAIVAIFQESEDTGNKISEADTLVNIVQLCQGIYILKTFATYIF